MTQNIGSLEARLGMSTRGLRRDIQRSERMFRGLSRNVTGVMSGITRSIGGMGAALATAGIGIGGGLAIATFFKKSAEAGMKFEQTMATVGGVMRATAEEQVKLAAAARHMGETTEFSATQAAESLQFLGMAGFQAGKAMAALPGTLDLATAGQIDLGRAADIATNALTAMGLPVEQLGRVTDVFVGTITRSNTNMDMMAESFKYAAPFAKAYGYSIEELSALIGILGNAGIQGSMAGTSLARSMVAASEIATEYRMESSDLIDVIEELKDRGYDTIAMMKLFDIRSAKVASVLFSAAAEAKAFQETLGGVGGEAKRLADIMRSTVGGSMRELKSVIESTLIDAFERYRDKLKRAFKDTTQWLRDHKDQIMVTVDAIVVAVEGVIASFQTIVSVLSGFASSVTSVFSAMAADVANSSEGIKGSAADIVDTVQQAQADIESAMDPLPLLTKWLELQLRWEQGWRNLTVASTAAAKIIGAVLAALAASFYTVWQWMNVIIERSAKLLGALAMVPLRLGTGNIKGALDDILSAVNVNKDAFGSLPDVWKAAFDEVMKASDKFAADFDLKTPKELYRDYIFSLIPIPEMAPDDDLVAAMERVGDIHTAKPVPPPKSDVADAMKKEMRLLEQQIALYGEILTTTELTTTQAAAWWEKYKDARLRYLDLEVKGMEKVGRAAGDIAAFVELETAKIDADMKALLHGSGDELNEWAQRLADDLNYVFEDSLFRGLKGQFESFYDFIETITDVFVRNVSRQMADAMSKILGLVQGGDGASLLPFGGMPGGGGSDLLPTPDSFGLAPISASVPTGAHRMNDPAFVKGLGRGASQSGNTYVTINIQTPDVASFKRSQSQVAAELSQVVVRAHRRNL